MRIRNFNPLYCFFMALATALLVYSCETPEAEGILSVSPTNISFYNMASERYLTITSTKAWTAKVEGDGFSLSSYSGEGNAEVKVSASDNESLDTRTGKITITSGDLKAEVDISQAGEDLVIYVEGDSVQVPKDGGVFEITVMFNTPYSFEIEEPAKSWIHAVETKTVMQDKLMFKVDANDSVEERAGKVTIAGKNASDMTQVITFTQKAEDVVVNVDGKSYVVPGEGSSFEVDVQYNTDFNVEINEDSKEWLSYEIADTKALKDGKIRFTAEYNYSPERKTVVTIKDKKGKLEPYTIEVVQSESHFRQGLMKLYNALDGPNWPGNRWWGSDTPFNTWDGVTDNSIVLWSYQIKGELPDCFEDFADYLESFTISSVGMETLGQTDNIKGTLPPSFAKLTKLKKIAIGRTTMTSLPDLFQNMPELSEVSICQNYQMAGPLPPSLGVSSKIERIDISDNSFTGNIPEEWCEKDKVIRAFWNHLSGPFPLKFYDMPSVAGSFSESYVQLDPEDPTRNKISFIDISNAPFIPGFYEYPEREYEEYDGSHFKMLDLIRKNKYTIIVHWGITNPYGDEMMKQVKLLYDKYHDKGLEIVAIASWGGHDAATESETEKYLKANGMDKWHNVRVSTGISSYPMVSPAAVVYTQDNHLIFTYKDSYPEAVDVFNKTATYDLLPFVQGLYGDYDPNYVSTDFSKDGEVMTLQKASKGNGINIVFMGDAYTDKDMNPGGLYETVMNDAMEAFFDIEPYRTFRDRFNVYSIKAVSKNCKTGNGYETRFGTGNNPYSRRVDGNVDLCLEYARKAAGVTSNDNLTVITLINSNSGGATCHSMIGYNSSVAFINAYNNIPSLYGDIVQHEGSGHGFGHLADEYAEISYAPDQSWIDERNAQFNEKNWWPNIDFTNDPAKVKWARFLNDSRYISTTGIFEGGGTYKQGVWRPSEDSMMNAYAPYFNAPSREAIYRRIMELSGEGYSWEKFLQYDAVNLGNVSRSNVAKHTDRAESRDNRQHTPPVISR